MFDLSSRTAKLVFGGVLVVIGFYLFFPIYWMITSSLKGNAELYRVIPTFFPQQFTFAHYWSAIAESKLLVYLGNSLIVSGASAAINTVLAVYAGYSFAKYRYAGRQPIMLFMLSAQMFPFGSPPAPPFRSCCRTSQSRSARASRQKRRLPSPMPFRRCSTSRKKRRPAASI